VINGCNIFLGQKLANSCSFVSGRIIVQQKNLECRNPLLESEEVVLRMFKEIVNILYATRRSYFIKSAATAIMFI
jgi:hypothetical protein